jgi:hypothetical protein
MTDTSLIVRTTEDEDTRDARVVGLAEDTDRPEEVFFRSLEAVYQNNIR